MSTQRRVSRTNPAIATDRGEIRRHWFPGCMGRTESRALRTGSALASGIPPQPQWSVARGPGITAPLMSIIWLAWASLFSGGDPSQGTIDQVATSSLSSDECFETFARLGSLRGSPPRAGAGDRRLPVSQARHMSSFRHIAPLFRVRARLPPLLAACPGRLSPLGGKVRWQKRFVFPARRMRRGLQF